MLIPVPFADADDLVARWRTLTDAEEDRAEVLLEDASYEVLAFCREANVVPDGDAAEQIAREATLKRIVCAMVKRAMIGGGDQPAIATASQSAGPFSQSQTFANPTGDLYLTRSEKRLLPCGKQRAFSIPLAVVEDEAGDEES